jgi:hypothetical protein
MEDLDDLTCELSTKSSPEAATIEADLAAVALTEDGECDDTRLDNAEELSTLQYYRLLRHLNRRTKRAS